MAGESERRAKNQLNGAISQAVQRIHQQYTGRGPTKARTICHGDVVLTLLEDTLTKAEVSLVADGQADVVLAMRRAIQTTMRDDLVADVERLTGKKVRGFLSQTSVDPDLTAELFVLDGDLADERL